MLGLFKGLFGAGQKTAKEVGRGRHPGFPRGPSHAGDDRHLVSRLENRLSQIEGNVGIQREYGYLGTRNSESLGMTVPNLLFDQDQQKIAHFGRFLDRIPKGAKHSAMSLDEAQEGMWRRPYIPAASYKGPDSRNPMNRPGTIPFEETFPGLSVANQSTYPHGLNHSGGVAHANRRAATDFGSPYKGALNSVGMAAGMLSSAMKTRGSNFMGGVRYLTERLPPVAGPSGPAMTSPIIDSLAKIGGRVEEMGRGAGGLVSKAWAAAAPPTPGAGRVRPQPRINMPASPNAPKMTLAQRAYADHGAPGVNRLTGDPGHASNVNLNVSGRSSFSSSTPYNLGNDGYVGRSSARPGATHAASPAQAATSTINPVPTTGNSAGSGAAMGMFGTGAMIGMGALAGGTASYASGGSFGQGAVMGGLAGGGIAGAAAYRNELAGMAGSYSSKVASFTSGFDDVNMRRGAIMGGGALGGFAFGGNRSHKRGFNQSRGNSIGR